MRTFTSSICKSWLQNKSRPWK